MWCWFFLLWSSQNSCLLSWIFIPITEALVHPLFNKHISLNCDSGAVFLALRACSCVEADWAVKCVQDFLCLLLFAEHLPYVWSVAPTRPACSFSHKWVKPADANNVILYPVPQIFICLYSNPVHSVCWHWLKKHERKKTPSKQKPDHIVKLELEMGF